MLPDCTGMGEPTFSLFQLSVAPTRRRVTCSSKPGVGGILFLLWPFSVACYLSLGLSYKVSSVLVFSLGNSKAAAHVAVDLQCWTL